MGVGLREEWIGGAEGRSWCPCEPAARGGGVLLCGAAHGARPTPFGAVTEPRREAEGESACAGGGRSRAGGGAAVRVGRAPPGAPVAAGARLLHRNWRVAAFCATPGWAKMEWTYEMRREMWVPSCPLHPIGQDMAVSVSRVCAAACGVAHALLVPVQIHADSLCPILAVQARGETNGHSMQEQDRAQARALAPVCASLLVTHFFVHEHCRDGFF